MENNNSNSSSLTPEFFNFCTICLKNKMIILFVFIATIFFYLLNFFIGHLDNGRYESIIVPYERIYGGSSGAREDRMYILDTRTGDYKSNGNNIIHSFKH